MDLEVLHKVKHVSKSTWVKAPKKSKFRTWYKAKKSYFLILFLKPTRQTFKLNSYHHHVELLTRKITKLILYFSNFSTTSYEFPKFTKKKKKRDRISK